jgi:arylsulfatase
MAAPRRSFLIASILTLSAVACNARSPRGSARERAAAPGHALVERASAAGEAVGQRSGAPGAATSTTTANPAALPNPPLPFGGVIGQTAATSKPWWPPTTVPPRGAPNVLLIMTDDAGYGVSSTFGGVIPTPTLDHLASIGLRYTEFHSTALCSPTRAAIITGRNHHSVGYGVVAEQATGFPGYDSIIPIDKDTVGQTLKRNGYATSWFGKDHNTPTSAYGQAGPFDQWPVGMGFDYFYGFLGGETDQWTPFLFRNMDAIYPWRGNPNYNLVTGMADDAIAYLRRLDASDPNKPFFMYYVPGASHAPHQPTREWIDKFRGKFDMGWNRMREQIFANQKRLGVIPQNALLTPWPQGQPEYNGARLPMWDQLSADERRLFARQAEVFAAYVAYNDHEIGRVIQEIENEGKLDNTLIIYITGDNGTSPEGSLLGTPFDLAALQGVDVPLADQLELLDLWGSPKTTPHMSAGWAWSFDTPFSWTKQIASHFGGTRQGMVMVWPRRIKDAGGIRNQFHHVIDIVPTILEAAGIATPRAIDGIQQKPLEGVSMVYTFDKANANAPSQHHTQYFEMFGDRAIYHDGWMAATIPPSGPWQIGVRQKPDPSSYTWQLFNVTDDFTQATDVADKYPDKLRELQQLFLEEAKKYQVLPLDNDFLKRMLAVKPSPAAGRDQFEYAAAIEGIPPGDGPNIIGRSFSINADVEVPRGGGNGMIVTEGGRFGGYGLYLLRGKPVFHYNLLAVKHFQWNGTATLAPGHHTLTFDFTYDGPGFGKGGTGVLSVDGQEVARQQISATTPIMVTLDETLDIGSDSRTPVNDADYQVPFAFNGTISKVAFKLGPRELEKPGQQSASASPRSAR